MVVITSEQRDVILDAVKAMYTDVARNPEGRFHFATGRRACEAEGYPAERLDRLPDAAVASFAGVANPFRAEAVQEGSVVLDIGSGSGTDALIAALLAGPEGRVMGLDMTPAMRQRLEDNAAVMGFSNVRALEGNAEAIPLPDDCVDVVTTNGVLNLVPDKPAAVREIRRVLRRGGRIQGADIVLGAEPSEACRSKPELWAECIVGATRREAYLNYFRTEGFQGVEVLARHDYFATSPSEATRELAASLGAEAIVFRAHLPE